jgi:hypothetical protein
MKRIILPFALCVLAISAFAQSDKYQKSMESNIALLDASKTSDEYTSVAATFERIGDAEKTQWLPYYYAALANIWKGFTDSKADKDAVAEKADALIVKSDAIAPDNAEIFLLKSMTATLRLLVDPPSRWQQYGAAVNENREKAKQLDPNNPRVYFLEAQNLFGTPKEFGGGKDKAKPLFEKSLELFKTYKPSNSLYPNWGQQSSEQMLEQTKL